MKESNPFLIKWILILQEFYFEVKDQNCAKNKVANHLLRLESNHVKHGEIEINYTFLNELFMSFLGKSAP